VQVGDVYKLQTVLEICTAIADLEVFLCNSTLFPLEAEFESFLYSFVRKVLYKTNP